jgi:hypothetical protein
VTKIKHKGDEMKLKLSIATLLLGATIASAGFMDTGANAANRGANAGQSAAHQGANAGQSAANRGMNFSR